MKKLLLIASFAIVSFAVNAQNKNAKTFSYSAGIELATFDPIFKVFGVGASAQADYALSNNLALTLNAGYISYLEGGGGIVPVYAGVKYNLIDDLYASLQAGAIIPSTGFSNVNFAFAPGIGYNITKDIDVQLRYVGILDNNLSNNLGLRLGYRF